MVLAILSVAWQVSPLIDLQDPMSPCCCSLQPAMRRTKMERCSLVLLRLGHLGLDILDLCDHASAGTIRLASNLLSPYLVYCGRHDERYSVTIMLCNW